MKTAPEILKEYLLDLALEDLTYEEAQNEDMARHAYEDIAAESRQGEIETNIGGEYSRHYESKSVAIHIQDFEGFTGWIGWTYWYGGGKHGYPHEIEWLPYAYFLDLVEEKEVVTVVRTFKMKE